MELCHIFKLTWVFLIHFFLKMKRIISNIRIKKKEYVIAKHRDMKANMIISFMKKISFNFNKILKIPEIENRNFLRTKYILNLAASQVLRKTTDRSRSVVREFIKAACLPWNLFNSFKSTHKICKFSIF